MDRVCRREWEGGVALIEPVSATELNEELRLSFS